MGNIQGAPLDSYPPEDQAFYRFWYGHMRGDLMTGPLTDVSHSSARYIWDAALSVAAPTARQSEDPQAIWRAIGEEAECVTQRGVKCLVLTEEMCVRLGAALGM